MSWPDDDLLAILIERATSETSSDLTIIFTVLADLAPEYDYCSKERIRIRSALRAANRIGQRSEKLRSKTR